MLKVIVEDGDLDKALKQFQRYSAETRKEAMKHQYYLRPGLRKMEKSKLAQRRLAKANKRG